MGQPSPQPIGLFDPTKLVAGMIVEIPHPSARPPVRGRRAVVAPIRGVVVRVDVPQYHDIIVNLRPLSAEQAARYGPSNFETPVFCNAHKTVRVMEIEP